MSYCLNSTNWRPTINGWLTCIEVVVILLCLKLAIWIFNFSGEINFSWRAFD